MSVGALEALERLQVGNRRFIEGHPTQTGVSRKELEAYVKIIRVLNHEIMNTLTPIGSLSASTYRLLDGWRTELEETGQDTGLLKQAMEAIKEVENSGRSLMDFSSSYRELMQLRRPLFKEFKVLPFLKRMSLLARQYPGAEGCNFQLRVSI